VRVLVAPQEFKGTLTAGQAAAAIAAGVRTVLASAEVRELPMSDGGPGLVDALLAARGGERRTATVHDPLMRPIEASWVLLADGSAAIEMAAASGLVLVEPERRNPLITTTFGTGELIGAALDAGCREIVIGSGGSATIDGGAGAAQALGVRLLDEDGHDLAAGGAALARLARIDMSPRHPRLADARLRVACDVTNVLCGPHGAAMVYGEQKGASADAMRRLDAALGRFAEVIRQQVGVAVATLPGSGSAGGLGAGLAALAGATLEPGFELVAEAVGLRDAIAASELVITGEGRLDAQTHYGKTVAGVAGLARERTIPIAVVAGGVDAGFDTRADGFVAVEAVVPWDAEPEERDAAMADAADAVRRAAERLVRRLIDTGAIAPR
jgi:glycerate kinase